MELWELVAREQIRDTLARYNQAGDRGRAKELAQQFLPDGVLHAGDSGSFTGRDAITSFIGGVSDQHGAQAAAGPQRAPLVRHHVSSVQIDVTPERATVFSYFVVLSHDGVDHSGRYRDVLVPFEGRWLFESRSVQVEAFTPGGLGDAGHLDS